MTSLTDVLVDYSKFWSDSMPDYKRGHIVRLKRCYVRQGECQTGYQAKRFFEKNQDIKSLCGS